MKFEVSIELEGSRPGAHRMHVARARTLAAANAVVQNIPARIAAPLKSGALVVVRDNDAEERVRSVAVVTRAHPLRVDPITEFTVRIPKALTESMEENTRCYIKRTRQLRPQDWWQKSPRADHLLNIADWVQAPSQPVLRASLACVRLVIKLMPPEERDVLDVFEAMDRDVENPNARAKIAAMESPDGRYPANMRGRPLAWWQHKDREQGAPLQVRRAVRALHKVWCDGATSMPVAQRAAMALSPASDNTSTEYFKALGTMASLVSAEIRPAEILYAIHTRAWAQDDPAP